MPKKLLFFLFLSISLNLFSQEKRINIFGTLRAGSITVKNVHIININTKKGTISNDYGEFQIPVRENDTLMFSDIRFKSQKITINNDHIKKLKLQIRLKSNINELDEVIIKKHNLSGNLVIDREKYKDPIPSSTKSALDFYSTKIISELDLTKSNKPGPSAALTDPIPQNVGIDFAHLYRLIKLLLKKRKKGLVKKEINYKSIRNTFTDNFFIKTLKIKPNEIGLFIEHCQSKGAIDLHRSGKKIELLDLLIKESRSYLKLLEDEK